MKIFIDVDNTILEHYGFYSTETENRIHRSIGQFPIENSSALKAMYDTSICHDPKSIKRLFMEDYVYILTKYPVMEFEVCKQERLAQVFNMTREELINLEDSKGNKKYISLQLNESKVDTVKKIFKMDSIHGCVLIDDYSQNIIEWERFGGVGIKYYNEYNSPTHPTNGISISNFKVFDTFLKEKKIENFTMVGLNKFKLKLISEHLFDKKDVNKINLVKIVYEDIKQNLEVSDLHDNLKNNYMDFLISYYMFMDSLHPTYWAAKVKKCNDNDSFSFMTSTFEPNIQSLTTELVKNEGAQITANILSSEIKKPKYVYDLYITVDEKKMITSIDGIFVRICNILSYLIKQ